MTTFILSLVLALMCGTCLGFLSASLFAVAAKADQEEIQRVRTAITEMVARAEYVIDTLRTRYVHQGRKFDEEAAQRALNALRFGKTKGDALTFFSHHGQSLNWIVLGDPAGMICGMAAQSEQAANFRACPPRDLPYSFS
jgi:hypothetical protein